MSNIKTDEELKLEEEAIKRKAIGRLASFYRENPHRLAKDYMGITLHWFQKILIYSMMKNDHFMFFAARSMGKTWLTALFCIIRCILFPGSKIVIAAGKKKQAKEVIDKITDDFMVNYSGSENIKREIKKVETNVNELKITFQNGSWIKAVTSTDNARGSRANVLIVDEFRMVDINILKTVLKKFLGAPRKPPYKDKPEYKHNPKYTEINKEIYMSSAWYVTHWCYKKAIGFYKNMLKGKKYFVCALPYQLSVREGLLNISEIQDEMSEPDFDQTSFDIESGCVFYGDKNGTFFKNEDISKNRVLLDAFPPVEKIYADESIIPKLEDNERRILSVDVALMASKKSKDNDASSIQINRALFNNGRYNANLVLLENHEGIKTQELALLVIKYFYKYKCTDIVLDTAGVGLSIFDLITEDMFDEDTGEVFNALDCIYGEDNMLDRCKVENAQKAIWSIKASQSFNNDICIKLRGGLQSGNIRLLIDDFKAETYLSKKKNFSKLSAVEQSKVLNPYKQTTLMLHELISLKSKVIGSKIRVEEVSGMRKDRYSSLAYNYWVMREIERSMRPENDEDEDFELLFRKPKYMNNDL